MWESTANSAWLVSFSNLGGSVINEAVLGLFKAGWSREDITMQHLEKPLQTEIMESAGKRQFRYTHSLAKRWVSNVRQ